MNSRKKIFLIGGVSMVLIAGVFFMNIANQQTEKMTKEKSKKTIEVSSDLLPRAYFSGGCFWCIEAPFQETDGVHEATSGYIGGDAKDAKYNEVVSGSTEHRESVEVMYDSSEISYDQLLEIFFAQIDPTDAGGQFSDRGFQYTSAIYFQNLEEKESAEKFIQKLQESQKFEKAIVVEIIPFEQFFVAEQYHQDFYKKSKDYYKKYKAGSGREDFIEQNWAKELALIEIAQQEQESKGSQDKKNFWKNYQKQEEDVLREVLTEEQFYVTQKEGTERPFDNAYWDNSRRGIYVDIVSGEPLFSSKDKYKSGTGWPSFVRVIEKSMVIESTDYHLLYPRVELKSAIAQSHLGHVFKDGPEEQGGLRYCMNSAALKFVPESEMEQEGYGDFLQFL